MDSIIVVEPRRGDFDLNNHLEIILIELWIEERS